MDFQTYKKNTVICREGEYQKWMFSIESGAVDVYAGFGTPEEKKLVTLTKGQFFGEIGMVSMMPRTATAVAAEDDTVLEQITYEALTDYMNRHPENVQMIMRNVSRRIRELTEDLAFANRSVNDILGKSSAKDGKRTRVNVSIKSLISSLISNRYKAEKLLAEQRKLQRNSASFPPVANFRTGEVIFSAGDPASCMYEIYSGSVGIYSDYGTANEKLLNRLYMESVFGEMGILDDMPRSATAVCLDSCSLLMVDKHHFMGYFQNKPAKIILILQQMCSHLKNLTQEYVHVCNTLEELSSQEDSERSMSRLKKLAEGHDEDSHA